MKIIDNFLDQENFDKLQNIIMGENFSWFYNDIIDFEDDIDKYQFIHLFYNNYVPTSNNIETINPLLVKIDPISLWRIKANLLTKTLNIVENEFHVDMNIGYKDGVGVVTPEEKLKNFTTSIFYVNTNNGYTKFEDGTKVESIANRFVSFSANLRHTGTSCTDEKSRVIINFNYFQI